VEELRQRVVQEWDGHCQRVIDSSVMEWRKRLWTCITADRGYL